MEDFVTRVATLEDQAAVENLLTVSYPALMASSYDQSILVPTLALITKANPLLLRSGTYYVVEARDGTVIGCGGWTREAPPGIDRATTTLGHLRHFGTHPQWIRRGVGRAIWERCIAAACVEGIWTFEVLSTLNGEEFYSALGFDRVREVFVAIGPDISFPCVLMRRELPQDSAGNKNNTGVR